MGRDTGSTPSSHWVRMTNTPRTLCKPGKTWKGPRPVWLDHLVLFGQFPWIFPVLAFPYFFNIILITLFHAQSS